MGLNLKILSPEVFAWPYTESIEDQTDHFAEDFVHETIAYSYGDDVMMFENLQLTPFCLEKSRVREKYYLAAFSVRIWLE